MHRILSFVVIAICLLSIISIVAESQDQYTDSIEREIRKTTNRVRLVDLYLQASKYLRYTYPDRAIIYADRALSLSDSLGDPSLRLESLIEVGTIQAARTEFRAGMQMALQAKDLARRLHDKKAEGDILLITGKIELYEGYYSKGLESHFMALRLFEEIGDREGKMLTLNGIGNICYYQEDYEKAGDYYKQALEIARAMDDSVQIANVINNIGLVKEVQGHLDVAIDNYLEASRINDREGYKLRLATNYANLGSIFMKVGRFDDSYSYTEKAIQLYSSMGSYYNLARSYLQLAEYYHLKNDLESQLKYLRMALTTSTKFNLRQVIYLCAGAIHEFYLSEDDIDSAYKYASLKNNEKDSIEYEKITTKVTLLEMEYNYDKKLQEDKLKQQRKDFIIILLVLAIVSVLVTTALFLSRQVARTKNIRLEKQRLSDEVEYKNKELALNVMNLIKKNELITDISGRLEKLEANSEDAVVKDEIAQLIRFLKRNSAAEIWDEFEIRFKQVYHSFYENLLHRFPELTPNELKICALLRLNFSTKEICQLTGQRPSSLDVARYRLRKKLGLANSPVNLVTFLSQV